METSTTQDMIDSATAIAGAVIGLPGVRKSWVDDYGRFGNFSLFVQVANHEDVDLRAIRNRLNAAVREHRKLGAHIRAIVMPRRTYRGRWRDRCFAGWNSDGRRFPDHGEISVSLDFHEYDAASNSFPALQPNGPNLIAV